VALICLLSAISSYSPQLTQLEYPSCSNPIPDNMASFLSNMLSSSQGIKGSKSSAEERPGTPTKNTFVDPVSTPQGSPSKKTIPPGAHELPTSLDNALKLNTSVLHSPVKLGRPQSSGSPLSPNKSNVQPTDDSYFSAAPPSVDNSIIHKSGISPDSPIKKQGQENTPPPRSRIPMLNHNQAALSRHELYQPRESRPITPTTKKFNTARGLTPEELEILKKPTVRRLVNVTQLCKILSCSFVVLQNRLT